MPWPRSPSRCSAWPTTSRTSFTLADTADSCSNALAVWRAMTWASVVLPVPGGPQRITDDSRSASTSTRSGLPGPTRSLLADDVVEPLGPQPGRQRRLLGQLLLGRGGEQVGPPCDPRATMPRDATHRRSLRPRLRRRAPSPPRAAHAKFGNAFRCSDRTMRSQSAIRRPASRSAAQGGDDVVGSLDDVFVGEAHDPPPVEHEPGRALAVGLALAPGGMGRVTVELDGQAQVRARPASSRADRPAGGRRVSWQRRRRQAGGPDQPQGLLLQPGVGIGRGRRCDRAPPPDAGHPGRPGRRKLIEAPAQMRKPHIRPVVGSAVERLLETSGRRAAGRCRARARRRGHGDEAC